MPFIPDSAETVRAFLEAEDIASRAGQGASSAHLLLALFTFPNRAQVLLNERGVDEELILREIRVMEDEPRRTLNGLRDRAREIAKGAGATNVDCLHLLIAITRFRDAFAYTLLVRTSVSLTSLRNIAVSYVTGHMPRRYRTLPKAQARASIIPVNTRLAAPLVLDTPPTPAPPTAAPQRQPVQPPPRPAPASSEVEHFEDEDAYELEPAGEQDEFEALADAVAASSDGPDADAEADAAPLRVEEVAPTLAMCGVDLTAQARDGKLDIAVGREREIESVVDILGKRRANNPVLVGPPGVGKTAIVECLAVMIARGDEAVSNLKDRTIFALDTGALVAGTSLRGAFSERLGAIKNEVAEADGRIVVFIDELHTLIGAGTSGEGPQDAANELKAALARGEFPCVGATTEDEFKKYIEKDPALERRFSPVSVQEPSIDEAILILEGAIAPYAQHHRVSYALEAVHAAVLLSDRFVTERKLPDKAFAVVDLAGSRACRRGAQHVTRLDVAKIVHEWSGVPLERLAEADSERFSRAESIIGEKLIGHPEVVSSVCRAVRRGYAGFNNHRPMGSFLFLGPTGVGKTELVKILAEFLFGHRDAIVRIDMSELSEKHSVARLIGAQPGYVGYDEGGQLTEALRKRPFQIVLFDEIEKAHGDVLNLLLQILDEGHLSDSKGRKISFANTLVVLTSNLGAECASAPGRVIGFGGSNNNDSGKPADGAPVKASSADGSVPGSMESRVLDAARGQLPPELWGRLEERLVFAPLAREQVRQIAELQLRESARALFAEREVVLEWDAEVIDFLLEHGGFESNVGARGMRQTIQRYVEGPIAERILEGLLLPGASVAMFQETGDSLGVRSVEAAKRA